MLSIESTQIVCLLLGAIVSIRLLTASSVDNKRVLLWVNLNDVQAKSCM